MQTQGFGAGPRGPGGWRHRLAIGLCTVLMLHAIAGCAGGQASLERVARDWCQAIRASQIIPVYPPTADLLPGDMFLVDRPAREQHAQWAAKGFLALPFELPRMPQRDLPALNDRYDASRWAMLNDPDPNLELNSDSDPVAASPRPAPAAAFPSYALGVSRGGSLGMAMPGPFGLTAAGGSARGTAVAMRGVRTFAYDTVELTSAVRAHWADPDRRAFLRAMHASSAAGEVYVRVVSRVYTVRSLRVGLLASDDGNVALTAGSTPVPAAIPEARAGAHASSGRAVTLDEAFEEPLVVGYLALDLPVNPRGELGPPVPTFDLLSGNAEPNAAWAGGITRAQRGFRDTRAALASVRLSEREEEAVYRAAAARLSHAATRAFDTARARTPPDDPAEAFNEAVGAMLEGVEPTGPLGDAVWDAAHEALRQAMRGQTPTPGRAHNGGGF